jgi:hypothetical protein
MSRQGKKPTGPFAGASFHIWALHVSLFLDPRYWSVGASHHGYQFIHTYDLGPIRVLWERDQDAPLNERYKHLDLHVDNPFTKPTDNKTVYVARPKDTVVCKTCSGSGRSPNILLTSYPPRPAKCSACGGAGYTTPYNWKEKP